MSYTFTELRDLIKEYSENTEISFVNNLDNIVKASEDRILYSVDLEVFRKNVTAAFTSSDPFLSQPTDFLAPLSLQITTVGSKSFLLPKDVNFVQLYTNDSSSTGLPKYYAIYDVDNFIVGPTPNSNYAVELHYFYRPTSLSESTQTLTVSNVSGTFTTSDTITGGTSGVKTKVNAVPSGTTLTIVVPGQDFTVGETVTGSSSSATGVVVSVTNDTTKSWLSTNAPFALFYGSLVEAYTYMKGEADLMQFYEQRFQLELSRLKDFGEARENADAFRRGLPDTPRT